MSNSKWAKVDTSRIVPKSVVDIPQQVARVNAKINNVFEIVATAIELIDKLNVTINDPARVSLKTALDAIAASLQEFSVGQRGVHYITIPIYRTDQPPVGPVVPSDSDSTIFSSFRLSDWIGSGGNIGFYNKVAQSLYDPGDLNRPQYNRSAFMSGFCVLAGANTTASLIDSIMYINRLVGVLGTGMDGNIVPTPTGLRARRMPLIRTATAGERITAAHPNAPFAIHLSWDPVFPLARTEYGVAAFNIKRVTIYRSSVNEGPISTSSKKLLDKSMYHTVPYSPKNFHFIDQDIEPNTEYYYAVGYTIEIVDIYGTRSVLANESVSYILPVDTSPLSTSQLSTFARGTPPDWQSLQSSLCLIPQLQDLILKVSLYVESLASSVGTLDSGLKQMARGLRQLVQTKELALRELTDLAASLQGLFEPTAGIYSFAFAGKGGNGYFLEALYQALTDRSDSSRPPFDTGKELVAGFILLGGAGSAADLNGITTLSSWFGIETGGGSFPNPYAAAGVGCPPVDVMPAPLQTIFDPRAEALKHIPNLYTGLKSKYTPSTTPPPEPPPPPSVTITWAAASGTIQDILLASTNGIAWRISTDNDGTLVTTTVGYQSGIDIVLAAPDSSRWLLSVDDTGTLVTTIDIRPAPAPMTLVVRSPDATSWQVTVDSEGTLETILL